MAGPCRRRREWGGIALLGFLLLGLGNGGVVYAEQWVPSGLTAVMVATSPFWMAGVEAFLPDGERLRRDRDCGLIIGFSGIVLLVWPDLTLGRQRARVRGRDDRGADRLRRLGDRLVVFEAARAANENVLGATAHQMLAGGLMMTAFGTVRGEWSDLFFTTRTAIALVYLSTIGAIGGFVAYTYALRHLPVSFVSLYAYINPVIAVALGVAVLHEPFTSRMALAAALVFTGVAMVRMDRKPASKSTPAASSAADTRQVVRRPA